MIDIGVMGLVFNSGNKGCAALGYSFLQIIESIVKELNIDVRLNIFSPVHIYKYMLKPGYRSPFFPRGDYENLKFTLVPLEKAGFSFMTKIAMKRCKVIFDFTAGDSFSDIYGEERFFTDLLYKNMALSYTKLVLGSQTYGPYKNEAVKTAALQVINNAYEVFSRDQKSSNFIEQNTKRKAITTSDIAFEMKYSVTNELKHTEGKIKLGINPSGLLWSGGYTGNNQFSLTVDYKKYLIQLITKLLETEKYEIHLIPHVFTANPKIVDNDLIACKALKLRFPELVMAPCYELPMDVKAYISQMDVFLGARMHATIAAVSTGVATIPFSYSQKFEGLYSSIQYPCVLTAAKLTTEEAMEQSMNWIEDYQNLRTAARVSAKIAHDKNSVVYNRTKEFISEVIS